MWLPEVSVRLWLYTPATDMRKSFNGLSALVKNALRENPLSGDLFIFLNRRRTMMKLLYFDTSGYCIWMKKLEAGAFQLPLHGGDKVLLNRTQLTLILEGIDLQSIKKRKRFRLPSLQ